MKTETKLSKMLSCSVCLQKFNEPTNLSCGHTFCLNCIKQVIS